jgi:hypothetical protein
MVKSDFLASHPNPLGIEEGLSIVFLGAPFQPFACQSSFSGKQEEKRQYAGVIH